MTDAETKFGLSSHLIFCILRHMDIESALATVDEAIKFKDQLIGIGLDSSENGFPPNLYTEVFERARDAGFKAVAHAGEEGPPDYVWEALDILKIDRLDHGNRSLEDEKLVARLVEEQMALTVCPLSNLKLRVVDEMTEHPLKIMLDKGLKATVNSDDPAYFGGHVNANYLTVSEALNLSVNDLYTLARNSFDASFLSADEKKTYID
jgi:adenosine deaminase